jgi:hypothetical protein
MDMLNALCEGDKSVSEWKEDRGYLEVPEVIVSCEGKSGLKVLQT